MGVPASKNKKRRSPVKFKQYGDYRKHTKKIQIVNINIYY